MIARAGLDAGRAQALASQLVPAAASQFFDAPGASAADRDLAPDRHWSNSRTIARHIPVIMRSTAPRRSGSGRWARWGRAEAQPARRSAT
ncbi:hypothetical protein JC607_13110 [Paracoccus sp. IB05]|nr:hypothetical protein [Paracoccus sp. IB05]